MNKILERIAEHGRHYVDPLSAIDWTAADDDLPWLPRSLLVSTDAGWHLSEQEFSALSRAEFVRLCAAGLWLEGLLINRVSENGLLGLETAEARVMLQEIREETGHSLMFLEMIDRAGHDDRPALEGIRLLTAVAKRLRVDTAEFWAMVYIGETVTDTFAMKALKMAETGPEPICPVAAQVLALHHREEARHIAAARQFLKARISRMTPARRWIFARTLRWLLSLFLDATMYPSADSLRRAGLPDPETAAQKLRACAWRKELATACAAPAVGLLKRERLMRPSTPARGEI